MLSLSLERFREQLEKTTVYNKKRLTAAGDRSFRMGVQGLARLLKEEGWLPRDTSCVKTLWRGSDFLSEDAHDRIVRLPPYSTLALDGNGLAYYLHHVAYSRYFAHVTGGSAVKSSSCSCRTKNLSETQVTRLLPQSMPLTWLDEVTKEFVESLERNHMTLVVYWDGEGRRMKAATTGKRKETRDTEWSNLRQYCMYGVVPRSSGTSSMSERLVVQLPHDAIAHAASPLFLETVLLHNNGGL